MPEQDPTHPLVSVLLPVFNAGLFLEECLDSICGQDFTDWEVIAVNDYSTDQSAQVLAYFSRKEPRIQWFDNKMEKGVISALRQAFAKSRGTYITRMDADDLMPSNKIGDLIKVLSFHGRGTVATGLVKYFSDDGLMEGYRRYAHWLNRLQQLGNPFVDIYKECVIPSPAWMVYRSDLLRAGSFDRNVYPEDYDLVFRFYQHGYKVVSTGNIVHFWRDHPDRSSRNMPEYAQQAYFDLKVPYFAKLDYNPHRPLVLWGSGRKGKLLAKSLQKAQLPFHWVCNTSTKWGKRIYGIFMQTPSQVDALNQPLVLLAVSGPRDQAGIIQKWREKGWLEGKDFFVFV